MCLGACVCVGVATSLVLFTSFVWVTRQKMKKKATTTTTKSAVAIGAQRATREILELRICLRLSLLLLFLLLVSLLFYFALRFVMLFCLRWFCFSLDFVSYFILYFAGECTLHFCGLASFKLDWPRHSGQVHCQQTKKKTRKNTLSHIARLDCAQKNKSLYLIFP